MNHRIITVLFLFIFLTVTSMSQTNRIAYPFTKKVDQQDDYHGTMISDPYRWLENDTAKEVAEWVDVENKVTNDYLSRIPFRTKMHERLTELMNFERYAEPNKVGDYYIFNKNDGLQNQSVYYVQKGLTGTPQVFIDPNKMSTDGTASVSLLSFSNDKKYCIYAVNQSGSDWQIMHIKEIATGKELTDEIKWVKVAEASWYKNGFFYCRFKEPGKGTEFSGKNEFHQVWYHQLNTPQSADKLIFEDQPNPMRIYQTQTSSDEKYLFVYVAQGSLGQQVLYKELSKPNSTFKMLFKGFDYDYQIVESLGSSIFVKTNNGAANNHVITIDLDLYKAEIPLLQQARVIVSEKKSLLETAGSAGKKILLNYLQDVSSHLYQYTLEGVLEQEVKLPGLGTVSGFDGDTDDREVFFTFSSFTYPSTIYRYHIDNHSVVEFKKPGIKFNPKDYVTEQVFYPSKDGTKVPMFIVYKKGLQKNGKNPTLLYAYGGFNVNKTPSFSASRIALLENGGIYVNANIRGGGEYGVQWHKDGMLLKKQNVFDDFIAAGEYLIKEKYTSPEYLAIQGGSNGGTLVGAVINQRPDLFRVAFPAVGVMDMLRYHKFTVGWNWAVEYGSSDSTVHFNNLLKYSPLHNIKPRFYPATLVTTADHDDRVVPAHSFKYIATLQQNQLGTLPVLIRIDRKAGHGKGKPLSKTIDEITDIYSFLFYNMNVPVKY